MMRSQSLSRTAEITAGRSSISPRIIVTLPVSTPTAFSRRSLSATSKITGRSPRSSNMPVAYAPTRPVPPVIKIPFFAIRILLSRYRYNKLIRRVNLIFRRTWLDSGGRYLDLLGAKMIAFLRQRRGHWGDQKLIDYDVCFGGIPEFREQRSCSRENALGVGRF